MSAALDRLWAGWRTSYIAGATAERAAGAERTSEARCVFCAILASGEPDEATHVLWRDPSGLAFALLNAYPYGSGHLMVLPTRHVADLEALGDDEAAAVWSGARQAIRAIKAAYRPDAANLGANLGEASGAGVPGHLHLHLLPRWAGDTNFMTAVAEARVLPEPLSVSAERLRAAWP